MIGELISGAANLIGGGINWLTGKSNREEQSRVAQQNIQMQKDFAQNGVRWKVDDARAAGVHPLFALGANTHSFSPVSVGSSSDSSVGDSIASAGQNIGRAAQAAMTAPERQKAAAADALTLEKAGLENELLRTQILSLKKSQLGPPMPRLNSNQSIPGQPSTEKGNPATPKNKSLGMGYGDKLPAQSDASDAEDWETRYGDLVQNIAGVGNLIYDGYHYAEPKVRSGWKWLQQKAKPYSFIGSGRAR